MIVYGGLYLLSNDPNLSIKDLIAVNRIGYMIAFIILFGFVYPMITFDHKEIFLAVTFEEEKLNIISTLTALGYEQEKNFDSVLRFRLKSKFLRFMRLFGEDEVELHHGPEKTIILYGMKKEIYRIGRHIEYLNKKYEQENPE